MLPDMSELPTTQDARVDVNYAVNAYNELQDMIRPQGGDMV